MWESKKNTLYFLSQLLFYQIKAFIVIDQCNVVTVLHFDVTKTNEIKSNSFRRFDNSSWKKNSTFKKTTQDFFSDDKLTHFVRGDFCVPGNTNIENIIRKELNRNTCVFFLEFSK